MNRIGSAVRTGIIIVCGALAIILLYFGGRYAYSFGKTYVIGIQQLNKGHTRTALVAFRLTKKKYPPLYYTCGVGFFENMANERFQQKKGVPPGKDILRYVSKGIVFTSPLPGKTEKVLENKTRALMNESIIQQPTFDTDTLTDTTIPHPVIREVLFAPVAFVGKPVFIKVTASNSGSDGIEGGITVSFPDKPERIAVMQGRNKSQRIFGYYTDSLIFTKDKKRIRARYPMIETFQRSVIKKNQSYSLSTFIIPEKEGLLRLYIRSALRGKYKEWYGFPSKGATDQQKWNVVEIRIRVSGISNPATEKPTI